MSDISIPGVTSKYNTDSVIEGLMKVERVPVTRMEESVDQYKTLKTTWQDISRYLAHFRDSAKALYDFSSPFQEKNAASSDETILSAVATRQASVEEREIKVVQTAKADRFLSSSLDMDFTVPGGRYGFSVGEEEFSFRFDGGSLREFAEMINRHGKNLVKANVVKDTADSQVILIAAEKTGASNRLSFLQKSTDFGLSAGILRPSRTGSREIPLADSSLRSWTEPLSKEAYSIHDGILRISPETELSIRIDPPGTIPDGQVLEISLDVTQLPEEEWALPSPPPGPDIPNAGGIDISGIHIENVPSKVDLPPWETPQPPKRVDDLRVFYTADGSPLPSIQNRPGKQTLQVQAGEIPEPFSILNIRNANTHREINITSIRIYDPEARGDYVPANSISEAGDSIIEIDGIQVTRDSNSVDDVIPGVTLRIEKESDRPVTLTVDHDMEQIKESIYQFVGHYDRLLSEISIVTSRDEAVVDEITYFDDDEREKALERLGLLQGDISLMQLKSSLQRIMMDPYETSAGRELSMMAQIGISTNSSGFSGSADTTKLRGYLEINDDVLGMALQEYFDAVEELFGSDRDGDLVVDSGVAYAVERYIKPYTDTGGIVSSRLSTLNDRIDSTEDRIEDYEGKLEDKEDQLRREYGAMEDALRTLEESSKSLDNMFNQQGN